MIALFTHIWPLQLDVFTSFATDELFAVAVNAPTVCAAGDNVRRLRLCLAYRMTYLHFVTRVYFF